ncbi:MAG: hypothetical protein IPK12_24720 [Gemmatimonadetes bacterium]|nr:hypothetical protein [Gemmatimonadota bacterium]
MRLAWAVVGALMAAQPVAAQAGEDSLVVLLRSVAEPLAVGADGRLAGAAGERLAARVRASRFVLLGEEHGMADVPRLAAALWRAGQDAGPGPQYLAIEVGPQMAGRLEAALRMEPTDSAYRAFLAAHRPGAPFYFWREDAALLRTVVAATPGRSGVLWGLDYDILADRHLFQRLRQLAPSAEARRVADSAIAVADGAFAEVLAQGNPGLLYMFGGSPALLARVRGVFRPRAGSEAEGILSLMEETLAINRLFMAGSGYESNRRRAALMRDHFVAAYRQASRGGVRPRVLFKFGATHLLRGVSFTQQFDLGTLVPAVAELAGDSALSLYAMGGVGSRQAQFDPRVMRSVEAPVDLEGGAELGVFARAAAGEGWTVFDLRGVRGRSRGWRGCLTGCGGWCSGMTWWWCSRGGGAA